MGSVCVLGKMKRQPTPFVHACVYVCMYVMT